MARPLRLRQLIQLEILNAADVNGTNADPLRVDGVDQETTTEVVRELQEQGLLAGPVSRNGSSGEGAPESHSASTVVLTEEGREYRRLLARKHRRAGGGTVADRTEDSGSRGGCPDDL